MDIKLEANLWTVKSGAWDFLDIYWPSWRAHREDLFEHHIGVAVVQESLINGASDILAWEIDRMKRDLGHHVAENAHPEIIKSSYDSLTHGLPGVIR